MLSVIVSGTEYSLDDGSLCVLLEHDGWGMPAIKRLSSRGPGQHGESDQGFHLRARLGMLVLGLTTTNLTDMYNRREQLLALFKPGNDPALVFTLPNGDTRKIDVHLEEGMTLPWKPKVWAAQRLALTLKAPHPAFYDPDPIQRVFGVSGAGSGLSFPISFPISFVSSIINEGDDLEYQGTWESYPTVVIRGPAENPSIENLSTGDKLALEYTLAAGEVVTISLTEGYKSIQNNSDDDLIGTLSEDSDIGSFHIAADPDVADGINQMRFVVAGAISGSTSIEFSFYNRFIGL